MLPNGDLLVKKIEFLANMGNYKCVAENDSGSDLIEVFLYPVSIGLSTIWELHVVWNNVHTIP